MFFFFLHCFNLICLFVWVFLCFSFSASLPLLFLLAYSKLFAITLVFADVQNEVPNETLVFPQNFQILKKKKCHRSLTYLTDINYYLKTYTLDLP